MHYWDRVSSGEYGECPVWTLASTTDLWVRADRSPGYLVWRNTYVPAPLYYFDASWNQLWIPEDGDQWKEVPSG